MFVTSIEGNLGLEGNLGPLPKPRRCSSRRPSCVLPPCHPRARNCFREFHRLFVRIVAPLHLYRRRVTRIYRLQREGVPVLGNLYFSRVSQVPPRTHSQKRRSLAALGRLGEEVLLEKIVLQREAFFEQNQRQGALLPKRFQGLGILELLGEH